MKITKMLAVEVVEVEEVEVEEVVVEVEVEVNLIKMNGEGIEKISATERHESYFVGNSIARISV